MADGWIRAEVKQREYPPHLVEKELCSYVVFLWMTLFAVTPGNRWRCGLSPHRTPQTTTPPNMNDDSYHGTIDRPRDLPPASAEPWVLQDEPMTNSEDEESGSKSASNSSSSSSEVSSEIERAVRSASRGYSPEYLEYEEYNPSNRLKKSLVSYIVASSLS